ncbi:MAG TPA: restriction endonuclease, partial [Edaphobacter sp.]
QLLVGTIDGPYEYRHNATVSDMHHYHKVRWGKRYSRDVLPQRILYSLGSVLTVFKFDSADEALRILRKETAVDAHIGQDEAEPSAAEIAQSSEAGAKELIAHRIAALDDNALESFFAGILRAMGYFTRVVGEGADGGVDIRAARDALFSQGPFLKVQVKARPNTAMAPQELRALAGVLKDADRGIFVSTGGFKPAARTEFGDRITLIDAQELEQVYTEYYERCDEQTRALLPLMKVWFPAPIA